MLYLGIDQHARQLTISLRDESGDVLQARQVSGLKDRICHRLDLFGVQNSSASRPRFIRPTSCKPLFY